MKVLLTNKKLICGFSDFVEFLKESYSMQKISYYIEGVPSEITVISTISDLKKCDYIGSENEYLRFEDFDGKIYSFSRAEFKSQSQILWPMFESENMIILRTDKYDFFNLAPYCIESEKTQTLNVDENNISMMKSVFEKYFKLSNSSILDLRNQKVKVSRAVGFISIAFDGNTIKVSDKNCYESSFMFVLNHDSEIILISK